ncbi:10717_t:CDS:2 [Cetraspora pellucida]|uniref:10717_t:CDS:1 n=1 Tax=Cetraspora pellucida TaxID=1433469 RepID=A0A9N8ZJE5_9GLOM|nr:10717_t:CDS:2 [Cetraspora pellucida]
MKRQQNSYTVEEKSKVIELARHTLNKFATHCYSLDLTIVEEAQLYKWIIELRKDGFTVNHSSIKIKMVEIMRSSARLAQDEAEKLAIANFKFSQHWLGHFLKHYDLSFCRKTNIAQKLPDDLKNKLLKFQQFVICLCQKNNYPLDDISHNIIIQAFKKCGISNCLSGSKDYLIYEDDSKDLDDANAVEDSSEDTDEDIGKGSDENTNKKNNFNNWPECFVVI